MNTRNLKWLRVRNWAVVVALVPAATVFFAILAPVIGLFFILQTVDENLKGGLFE